MTTDKARKRAVRTRMQKTGERYAAARRHVTTIADAPAWGNSSKASFTGSPNFASIVVGAGSTSFAVPTTGLDVTVTGAPGTASSENAVNCSNAFPPFRSVNSKSPI